MPIDSNTTRHELYQEALKAIAESSPADFSGLGPAYWLAWCRRVARAALAEDRDALRYALEFGPRGERLNR